MWRLSARLSWLKASLPRNTLTYGVDFYRDWVSSSAERETIETAEVSPRARGRYIDDSTYLRFAAYLTDRIQLSDKLFIDAGGRFVLWSADIPGDSDAGLDPVDTTSAFGVGGIHASYLYGSGLNFVFGVSSGFRAPNIDDFSAQGCSGQGFDVPNSDLSPEKSITAETGIKVDLFDRVRGSLFYAYTHLSDTIVREPTTLQTPSGPVTEVQCGTASDGSPVFAEVTHRVNAQSASLHSVEGDVTVELSQRWSVFTWAAWTQGDVKRPDTDAGGGTEISEPLSRVPPLSGLVGVRYDADARRWFTELAMRWSLRQSRLSERDRQDARICPDGPDNCDGTAGYAVFTARGGVSFWDWLRATLTIENLSHEGYKVHGSGVFGAGISAVVGLEAIIR